MKSIQNITNLIANDKLRQAVLEILAITKESDNYNSAVILALDLCSFENAKVNTVFALGIQRTRYIGLAKTHLQQVAASAAIKKLPKSFWPS